MIDIHPTDLPGFAGWHRPSPSRPWQCLVEADSEAECLDLLAARVEGVELAVMPRGQPPGLKDTRPVE